MLYRPLRDEPIYAPDQAMSWPIRIAVLLVALAAAVAAYFNLPFLTA